MDRFVKFVLAGVFALATTGLLWAQQQGTQPQTGKTSAKGNVTYQGSFSQTPWFSDQSVRQQLKFSDDQYNQLNKAYGQAYQRYQQGVSQLDKTLTDDQRRQRTSGLQQDFYKNFSTATNELITDPQVRNRYNQMYWQYQGYDAFNDPMIQQKLNLTSEQRQKLGRYNQEWTTQMGELGQAYQTDREGTSKRFNTLRRQNNERINSVLNQQQQQTWQQMIGDPYDFQPNIYFQGSTNSSGGTRKQ